MLAGAGESALAEFLHERGWAAERIAPVQVFYRPGTSLVVRFRALARRRSGPLTSFTLTAEARGVPRPSPAAANPPGDALLPDPVAYEEPYVLWAFPYDPSLPGLPAAAAGTCLRSRPAGGAVRVEPLRYRPRRRAVLRYRLDESDALFAKVLAPSRARPILAAARRLRLGGADPPVRLALPVPGEAPGTLLVRPLEGRCLRDLLLEGGRLPAPERIAQLPEALAALGPLAFPDGAPGNVRRGRPTLARAEQAKAILVRLLPVLAGAAARVVDAVADGIENDPLPDRVVHGDLYEGQVFVGEDLSLGLIDLDDLGPGDPALDAANFCAHLLAVALAGPGVAADRFLAYRALVRRAFLTCLDVAPESLAWREAFAMLLLATGPFRTLHPDWARQITTRVETAEQLVTAKT